MDYSRRELADRLAAEHVLGTLRGPARRRFEALLPAHPALREAVAKWQERLAPLSQSVAPVPPPDTLWPRVEARLFGAPPAPVAPLRWWQKMELWRGLTAMTGAAALALMVVVATPPPAQAPIVVVLAANPEAAQALNASFVASVSADGRALVLRPLNALTVSPDRALELWAVPGQGAPRSLGLVKADGATSLLRAQLLQGTAAFAVSLEPAGGSPTGAPTGPIVSVGKLQS
ncbi:anti-sigma factor domain-containing protein [Ideonella sp. A 288]|uniref:anti-sigma factor n=1 Tax=Ideonella sp. A 288 TaxID=1962181 RepID=UPI000B4B789B|nr:anti-sigma factor [Ideonella sp. A 288]